MTRALHALSFGTLRTPRCQNDGCPGRGRSCLSHHVRRGKLRIRFPAALLSAARYGWSSNSKIASFPPAFRSFARAKSRVPSPVVSSLRKSLKFNATRSFPPATSLSNSALNSRSSCPMVSCPFRSTIWMPSTSREVISSDIGLADCSNECRSKRFLHRRLAPGACLGHHFS